jgi:hypothetical protein
MKRAAGGTRPTGGEAWSWPCDFQHAALLLLVFFGGIGGAAHLAWRERGELGQDKHGKK